MLTLTKKVIYDLHTHGNLIDLTNIRKNIHFADDYDAESKPAIKSSDRKFKTDRERVKEIQKHSNYKNLRS